MARTSSRSRVDTRATRSRAQLRHDIIEEDRLRREVERHEEMQSNAPKVWDWMEERRLASNRETDAINRRLRRLGLELIALRPSFAEVRQELQRLERSNAAAIARLERTATESRMKRRGTRLASNGPRRHVKEGP